MVLKKAAGAPVALFGLVVPASIRAGGATCATQVRRRVRALRVGLFLAAVTHSNVSSAGETTLAEPIVEENITDVDATEIGTLEVDVTGSTIRPNQRGRAGTWASALEAEWRPVDRLGLGAELSMGDATNGLAPRAPTNIGTRVAASYVFLRDLRRNLFLQAEAAARWEGETAFPNPVDSALPYTFGVRWATQLGPITLRAASMGEASGAWAHAPVRASTAALARLVGPPIRAYVGVEVIADWARQSPLLAVPQALLLFRAFGAPIRVGVGVPVTLGARVEDAAFGIAFRLVLEPDE